MGVRGRAASCMRSRAFVDTNVVVYAVDDADPVKRDAARELLRTAEPAGLVLSTQVLCEFYVVVTRRLAVPLAEGDAQAAVELLAKLPLVATDAELVRSGISVSRNARLSLWDGLIVAAAETTGCDVLLSEDLGAGATYGSVRVENPFQ